MKQLSAFTRASSGGPKRASVSLPNSVCTSRPLTSSRGNNRLKQRSWVSSCVQQDGLAEYVVADGALDETQASLLLIDEELRQSAERYAKKLRQLHAREVRQRALIYDEEAQQFEKIDALQAAYSTIATTCANLRASREAAKQRDIMQSQQWSLQLIADAVQDVVRSERVSRRAIQHAEAAVRGTMVQLQRAGVRDLELHEGVFRLIHAEQIRRAFLLREEARGVEALQIPHYISLPCVAAAPAALVNNTVKGASDVAAIENMREVDKMDLMADERCPFRCAADCPYMPLRTRHLGAMWNAANCSTGRSGRAGTASDGRQQRNGVTEVGRQRVRYAMAKEHLHDTPTFLPSLRV